ncbi:glycosidase [candidate division KSB1 bacterium]|nr:glycosidase [candidate division KSB1 bacterium]
MTTITDYVGFSELFRRFDKNPILTPANWPYPVNAVFNPGATKLGNETLLLVRVEDMEGFSHLTVTRSEDGKTNWHIDSQPTLLHDLKSHPEEVWGIEDPRIVWLEERQEYAITYASFSRGGPLVSLTMTKDFKTFKRMGAIMPPDDKDASLFPRRFGGRWILIHRPMPVSNGMGAHIWFSYSPDLKYWGDHHVVIEARQGGWWDANKIGLGPQPLETEEGWLILYHGVRRTASGSIYRLGLALLDLEEPWKVIRRSNEWIFGPKEVYERIGGIPNVIFPCGAVIDRETNELRLYYGAADTTIGLAMAKMDELLDYIKSCPGPKEWRTRA